MKRRTWRPEDEKTDMETERQKWKRKDKDEDRLIQTKGQRNRDGETR